MDTLDYYDRNALEYSSNTKNADMSMHYKIFLKYLNGRNILDFGCGGGRDSLYFKSLGYNVTALDGSKELCKIVKNMGINTVCINFNDFEVLKLYDGIWACSSLLHLSRSELKRVLIKLKNSLTDDGILYISLKDGNGYEVDSKGRYFSYINYDEFFKYLNDCGLEIIEYFSNKSTINNDETHNWDNYYIRRK